MADKYYSSVIYSPDGTHLLAAGHFPYVSLYHVSQRVLLNKIIFSRNHSLLAKTKLNSKHMKDG